LCGYTGGTDQKLRESFLHQLIIWTKIKCNSTYYLMDKFSTQFFFTRPLECDKMCDKLWRLKQEISEREEDVN
jgi:hypothetical protein